MNIFSYKYDFYRIFLCLLLQTIFYFRDVSFVQLETKIADLLTNTQQPLSFVSVDPSCLIKTQLVKFLSLAETFSTNLPCNSWTLFCAAPSLRRFFAMLSSYTHSFPQKTCENHFATKLHPPFCRRAFIYA